MSMTIENLYDYMNLESIKKDLICKICDKPFIEPVTTPCGNTFCRQCVEQWLEDHNLKCPSCSESVLKNQLISLTDLSTLALLDQIQVQCKLCEQTNLERSNFQNHIVKQCSNAIVTCSASSNNCPWIGLREEFQTHLTTCPFEPLKNEEPVGDDVTKQNHGEFLPFSNINLQQRHFHNQDIAIAVKALLINKRCTSLDLFNKGISSEGAYIIAAGLYKDTLLETLELRNNLICDSGIQFLVHPLSTNTSHLKRLDLNDNSITDTGVRLLADMLKTNTTLIKLTLSFNRISNEGMDILADVLINYNSTLQWLSLVGNPAINDSSIHSIIQLIKHNQSLTTLNLEDCKLSWWSKTQIYFWQRVYLKSSLDLSL